MDHKSRIAAFGSGIDDNVEDAGITASSTNHTNASKEEVLDAADNENVSDNADHPNVINRVPAGRNYFLRRQLSNQRKKLLASRARAQDLFARFELSEAKCTDLSKMSSETVASGSKRAAAVTGAPKFAAALSTKQAMKAVAKKEAAQYVLPTSAEGDPLLTERERKALETKLEIEQRMRYIHSRLSPASQLTIEPAFTAWAGDKSAKSKEAKSTKTHSQSVDAIKSVPWLVKGMTRTCPAMVAPTSKLGGKVVLNISPGSPSSYSVAPTEANTPSPRSQPSFESIDGRSTGLPRFNTPLHSLC